MRVVSDTNVLVSALLWSGAPHKILVLAEEGLLDLYTSPALLNELAGVLSRPKFAKRLQALRVTPEDLVAGYARLAHVVLPKPIPPTVIDDAADDAVLACAYAANASYLISGDFHLLCLKSYKGILIVSPQTFFRQTKLR